MRGTLESVFLRIVPNADELGRPDQIELAVESVNTLQFNEM
jgi:hypothetical protein